jgi:hypothetical protein
MRFSPVGSYPWSSSESLTELLWPVLLPNLSDRALDSDLACALLLLAGVQHVDLDRLGQVKSSATEHQIVQGQQIVSSDMLKDTAHIGVLVGRDGVFGCHHKACRCRV